MKKIIILFILIFIFLAGCQSPSGISNVIVSSNAENSTALNTAATSDTVTPDANSTPAVTETTNILSCYKFPETLDELVNKQSYNIFIAYTEKVLPAERDDNEKRNYTPVQVKVLKAIKGPVKEDMTLNISLNGGVAGGVNQFSDGEYTLKEGKTYLLFVSGRDTTRNHCYQLAVPYYSNPQIIDGKLVDYKEEAFHLPSGLTVDEVVNKIQEVSKK